jgi:regulator of sirC expression with transglutaminase-like and TPR domain
MTPTERFRRLVEGPEEALALDEGALLIGAHARPDLDVDAYLDRLDELAGGCPEATVDGVVGHLFHHLGFRGNTEDYGDPRNSYLDQVLDRRLGIPITLAVLLIEVGRRVGVPFSGIGLPGHFVVRHEGVPRVLLDPFEGGRTLTAEDCEERVRRIYGEALAFEPAMLTPVGRRAILARMLANLKQRFTITGDAVGAEWAIRLRTLIPDVGDTELAELAGAQAAIGREPVAEEPDEEPAGEERGHDDHECLHGRAPP